MIRWSDSKNGNEMAKLIQFLFLIHFRNSMRQNTLPEIESETEFRHFSKDIQEYYKHNFIQFTAAGFVFDSI